VANRTKHINLEECLEHGNGKVIEGFCLEYFQNCEFVQDYTIENICADGNIKLFCGYFKGEYGIIEIEVVGLYPKEIEEISTTLISEIQVQMLKVPKRWGRERFNYEIAGNRITLRFYACKKSDSGEKEEILGSLDELYPALETLENYLQTRIITH
jgi:hypothetical protein